MKSTKLNIKNQISSANNRSAFTLVELLVAIALFSVVISIAVGGFVRALRTQRQVTALIAANSNASLTVEQIAREVRTGRDFLCQGIPCEEIIFTNSRGEEIAYRFREEAIERRSGSGEFRKITADNVDVRYASFQLFENQEFPPRITVALGVSARMPGADQSVTRLQTTVSAR